MSYYNHMNDVPSDKKTCNECGKDFHWVESGNIYPGGKDREYINCPYCGSENGSIMTSGTVFTSKIDK